MDDPTQKGGQSRVWRLIFGLSLVLNLAVIGVVAGAFLRDQGDRRPARGFDLALGPVAGALADSDRKAIRDALRDSDVLPPRRGKGDPGLADLVAALKSIPYDPAAIRVLLREPMARLAQVQGIAADALAVQIDAMTAAERAEFAARVDVARQKRHR